MLTRQIICLGVCYVDLGVQVAQRVFLLSTDVGHGRDEMLADLQGRIVKSADHERVVERAFPKPPLVEAQRYNKHLNNHLQQQ